MNIFAFFRTLLLSLLQGSNERNKNATLTFKGALVKKLIEEQIFLNFVFKALPDDIKAYTTKILQEGFTNLPGKIRLEGGGDVKPCPTKGTRANPEFDNKPGNRDPISCCKFRALPELKVSDFPAEGGIGFPPPPAVALYRITLKVSGKGEVKVYYRCLPPWEGGKCENDYAECENPKLHFELSIVPTLPTNLLGTVTVIGEIDLGQKLSLTC